MARVREPGRSCQLNSRLDLRRQALAPLVRSGPRHTHATIVARDSSNTLTFATTVYVCGRQCTRPGDTRVGRVWQDRARWISEPSSQPAETASAVAQKEPYTVALVLPVTVRLVVVIATLAAPPPALAADGLHVRASGFATRLTVL